MALPVKKFSVPFNVAATAAADLIAIESSATDRARLTRIVFTNPGVVATTAVLAIVQLLRTTTAGSGGVVTPQSFEPTDVVYSGIVRSGVGVGGTGGVVLEEYAILVPIAVAAFEWKTVDFYDRAPEDGGPAPTTTSGVANGLALRVNVGAGAAGFRGFVEFIEEA